MSGRRYPMHELDQRMCRCLSRVEQDEFCTLALCIRLLMPGDELTRWMFQRKHDLRTKNKALNGEYGPYVQERVRAGRYDSIANIDLG